MDRKALLIGGAGAIAAAGGVAATQSDGGGAGRAGRALPARPLRLPASGRVRVAFVIGDHVNVIDTAGPWETFQDAGGSRRGPSPFDLYTVAPSRALVEATAGLRLVPHHAFASAPQPDVIVVPAHAATPATRSWLRSAAKGTDVVMSVCTGAFVLGEAGLLDGRSATTHHEFLDQFASSFPSVRLVRDHRFVEDGPIAPAAGLTSGIDLALRVVSRYLGDEVAAATAAYMEHRSARWRTA